MPNGDRSPDKDTKTHNIFPTILKQIKIGDKSIMEVVTSVIENTQEVMNEMCNETGVEEHPELVSMTDRFISDPTELKELSMKSDDARVFKALGEALKERKLYLEEKTDIMSVRTRVADLVSLLDLPQFKDVKLNFSLLDKVKKIVRPVNDILNLLDLKDMQVLFDSS